MKALFIVPSLKRAGAESQVVSLVNSLDPARFEPHLLIFGEHMDLRAGLDESRVHLHLVKRKSKLDFALVQTLVDLINREEFGVIYSAMQYSYLYAWLAAKRVKKKPGLIAALHTTINVGLKEELQDRLLYRFILQRADKLIFVCDSQKKYWLRRYPSLAPLAVTVHNGIDVKYFDPSLYPDDSATRKEYGLGKEDFVFCCIAGFRPEKGHKILLRAFAVLDQNAKLVLVGDGPLKAEIKDEAQRLGVLDRVRFTGVLQDVRPVLALAQVSILASTAVETFSMAMLESMAMQVPVIATDIGGLKEAIIPGENGMLVLPGDQQALYRSMCYAMEDPERLAIQGVRARDMVIRKFTVETMTKATEEILIGTGTN